LSDIFINISVFAIVIIILKNNYIKKWLWANIYPLFKGFFY
jgi:hypothetical protein